MVYSPLFLTSVLFSYALLQRSRLLPPALKETGKSRSMVERFFFVNQIQTDNHLDNITLLSGPPSCGKTSLLFQFAFNSAQYCTATNTHVVFICHRRRLETKPPYLSQGIDASCDVFDRIQMKYVDDAAEFNKYFAAFHIHSKFPAAVIVDDFGDLFQERSCQEKYSNPRGRDLAMVRTLALCHNAIVHANMKGCCKLLLSDTHHGDSPRSLFIYKRWIPAIVTVKGDERGSFLLRGCCNSWGSSSSMKKKMAKFSIAFQYLVLEGFLEEGEQFCS